MWTATEPALSNATTAPNATAATATIAAAEAVAAETAAETAAANGSTRMLFESSYVDFESLLVDV